MRERIKSEPQAGGGSGFSQCIEGQTDGQVTGAGTGISGDKTKRFPCGNCCNFDSTTSTVEHLIAILLLPLYEGVLTLSSCGIFL